MEQSWRQHCLRSGVWPDDRGMYPINKRFLMLISTMIHYSKVNQCMISKFTVQRVNKDNDDIKYEKNFTMDVSIEDVFKKYVLPSLTPRPTIMVPKTASSRLDNDQPIQLRRSIHIDALWHALRKLRTKYEDLNNRIVINLPQNTNMQILHPDHSEPLAPLIEIEDDWGIEHFIIPGITIGQEMDSEQKHNNVPYYGPDNPQIMLTAATLFRPKKIETYPPSYNRTTSTALGINIQLRDCEGVIYVIKEYNIHSTRMIDANNSQHTNLTREDQKFDEMEWHIAPMFNPKFGSKLLIHDFVWYNPKMVGIEMSFFLDVARRYPRVQVSKWIDEKKYTEPADDCDMILECPSKTCPLRRHIGGIERCITESISRAEMESEYLRVQRYYNPHLRDPFDEHTSALVASLLYDIYRNSVVSVRNYVEFMDDYEPNTRCCDNREYFPGVDKCSMLCVRLQAPSQSLQQLEAYKDSPSPRQRQNCRQIKKLQARLRKYSNKNEKPCMVISGATNRQTATEIIEPIVGSSSTAAIQSCGISYDATVDDEKDEQDNGDIGHHSMLQNDLQHNLEYTFLPADVDEDICEKIIAD